MHETPGPTNCVLVVKGRSHYRHGIDYRAVVCSGRYRAIPPRSLSTTNHQPAQAPKHAANVFTKGPPHHRGVWIWTGTSLRYHRNLPPRSYCCPISVPQASPAIRY
ncbi:unnamed protein product [Ectocarpus sp. 12 AP-2014]